MRVVLDTSVVVAASIAPAGAASALLRLVLAEGSPLQSCMSLALSLEYRDVLGRAEMLAKARLSASELETLLEALEAVSSRIDILFPVRPSAADSDDDFVVELVVNARAERLVTYNVRDFVQAAATWGFVVATPGALLHELRKG